MDGKTPDSLREGFNSIVTWEADDDLAALWTTMFGLFPTGELGATSRRLTKFTEFHIARGEGLPEEGGIGESQIDLTARKLRADSYGSNDAVVIIGNPKSTDDLTAYWNLRAAGLFPQFVPEGRAGRVLSRIKRNIRSTIVGPPRSIHYILTVFRRIKSNAIDLIRKDIRRFGASIRLEHPDKLRWLPPADWQTREVMPYPPAVSPATYYFHPWEESEVQKPSESEEPIKLILNEKPIPAELVQEFSQLVFVEVMPPREGRYNHKTIRIPFIPKHLSSLAHVITGFPAEYARLSFARAFESETISTLVPMRQRTISLREVTHESLIFMILKSLGIEAQESSASIYARQLVELLGGRVNLKALKFPGFRAVLESASSANGVTRQRGISILNNNPIGPHSHNLNHLLKKGCHSDPVEATDFFDWLISQELFHVGLALECPSCKRKRWYSADRLKEAADCDLCGNRSGLIGLLKEEPRWSFKSKIQLDRNERGTLPVWMAILRFLEASKEPATDKAAPGCLFRLPSGEVESDLVVIGRTFPNKPYVVIGECKTTGDIDSNDVKNLLAIRNSIAQLGVDCLILFTKLMPDFSPAEKRLIKPLLRKGIPVILFGKTELEEYDVRPGPVSSKSLRNRYRMHPRLGNWIEAGARNYLGMKSVQIKAH